MTVDRIGGPCDTGCVAVRGGTWARFGIEAALQTSKKEQHGDCRIDARKCVCRLQDRQRPRIAVGVRISARKEAQQCGVKD